MTDEVIQCEKCGDIAYIEGEYPKFHAWCDTCGDYAPNFDINSYAAEYMSDLIDYTYDMMKDKK